MAQRFLLLADNLRDADAIQSRLVDSSLDYELMRVGTGAEFVQALSNNEFDLILADYTLSHVDGISALEIAGELCPDIPFIFISGSLGEELAIAALQQGATDYVLKQRLERLVPAVERALHLGEERRSRLLAEQACHESKIDFHTLFNITNVGMAQIDPMTGRLRRVNAAYCAITGYTEQELLAMTIDDLNHPDDRGRDRELFASMIDGAASDYQSEKRYVRKDGNIVWVLVNANVIRDPQGRPLRTVAVIHDITERKQTEAALRRSEERLRVSQELSLDAFTILDSVRDETGEIIDFVWTYINPTGAEILQHPAEELLGKRLLEVLPGNQLNSELFVRYVRVVETGEPHDIELRYNADGIKGWFRNMAVKLEDGVAIFFKDITERKENEQALRNAEERLRVALQNAPITVFNQDCELKYTWIYKPVQYDIPEIIGKSDRDLLSPENSEPLTAIKQQVLETGIGAREEVKIAKDDRDYYYDLTIEPLRSSNNQIIGVTCAAIDISELKQAEINLRNNEERLKLAMAAAQLGTWDSNLLTGEVIWSDLNFKIFGYEPAPTGEVTEAMWSSRIHPEDYDQVIQEWQQSCQEHRLYRAEYRAIRADDRQVIWLAALGSFTYNQNGEAVRSVGVFFDISDRKGHERNAQFLADISQDLASANNIQEILAIVGGKMCAYFGFSRLKFAEINDTTDQGRVIYCNHDLEAENLLREYRLTENFSNSQIEHLKAGGVVTIKDGGTSQLFGARSMLIAPCVSDGRLKFVVIANRQTSSHWRSDEMELMQELATRIWIRIENAHAEENLRHSEARYRYLVEAIPQLVWTADAQGQNDYVNQQMCDYIGLSYDEVLGLNWQTVIHADDLGLINQLWGVSVQNGTPYEAEYRLRHSDGTYRWHLVRAMPFRDEQGQIIQWFGVSTDIHDKQELEKQRSLLLQQEQAAREEAERANRIKDEFLAVLSHELRSPLNPILGWSQLLQKQKLTPEKIAQGLATIERNAKLQVQLIEDLLDVSRILRGKLVLNSCPVNLVTTIEGAMETVRLAATAKNIQLQTHLDPQVGSVCGDSVRLQQVIWNLLTNGIKFTPQGGRVEVRLAEVDNFAQIQVQDTGKGISPQFLPYVFDYFRQEDGAITRKFGGLGLGLAIVRYLVELHGGTVQADSPGENLGATFTVKLPLMPTQSNVNLYTQLPELAVNLKDVQVLVVDDETDTRKFLALLLTQAGARVTTAASAVEAFNLLKRSPPNILISDIGMPGIDGYMLLRQIRALPPERGGKIKAIALTAYASEVDREQALSVGFQQHIAKPVETEALLRAIASLVNSSQRN